MHEEKKEIDSKKLADCIVSALKETKAKDVVVLDLRNIENSVTDFFIICSGESFVQIDGISTNLIRSTRTELHQRPWHQEGKGVTNWVLLDYVNVVVHIFQEEIRNHYNLEELWADAERTDIPNED